MVKAFRPFSIDRLIIFGCVAAILLSGPSAARADLYGQYFINGNMLWDQCSQNRNYCLGYIMGIDDAIEAANGFLLCWKSCVPREETGEQVVDVVIQYLGRHPEERHYGAPGIIAHALQEAFPCS